MVRSPLLCLSYMNLAKLNKLTEPRFPNLYKEHQECPGEVISFKIETVSFIFIN